MRWGHSICWPGWCISKGVPDGLWRYWAFSMVLTENWSTVYGVVTCMLCRGKMQHFRCHMFICDVALCWVSHGQALLCRLHTHKTSAVQATLHVHHAECLGGNSITVTICCHYAQRLMNVGYGTQSTVHSGKHLVLQGINVHWQLLA